MMYVEVCMFLEVHPTPIPKEIVATLTEDPGTIFSYITNISQTSVGRKILSEKIFRVVRFCQKEVTLRLVRCSPFGKDSIYS